VGAGDISILRIWKPPRVDVQSTSGWFWYIHFP